MHNISVYDQWEQYIPATQRSNDLETRGERNTGLERLKEKSKVEDLKERGI